MQSYVDLQTTDTLSASRDVINNNIKTALSNSSGSVFPTTNLQIGMGVWRTDQNRFYVLQSTGPSVWNQVWTAASDGAGSGLDADLLDGQEGSFYSNIPARLGYTPLNRAGDTMSGDLTFGTTFSAGKVANYRYVDISGTAASGGGVIRFGDGTAYRGAIYSVANGIVIAGESGGNTIRFDWGGVSSRMTYTSLGHVLFATTTNYPGLFGSTHTGYMLEYSGDGASIIINRNAFAPLYIGRNTDGPVTVISRAGAEVASITVSATGASYNTTSDYRLKENEEEMTGAISRVKQLVPRRFNWKVLPGAPKTDGFFAHELQEVVPEAVSGVKDAVDAEDRPVHQQVDFSRLVPLLTGALKEAIERIEALEVEVATLKGQ